VTNKKFTEASIFNYFGCSLSHEEENIHKSKFLTFSILQVSSIQSLNHQKSRD